MQYAEAKEYFAKVLELPCPNPECPNPGVGELCDRPGLWVCLERLKLSHTMSDWCSCNRPFGVSYCGNCNLPIKKD